ncbi:hypothetical protein D6833_08910, partial [Candidatus Parcubacteria bacterium]
AVRSRTAAAVKQQIPIIKRGFGNCGYKLAVPTGGWIKITSRSAFYPRVPAWKMGSLSFSIGKTQLNSVI